MSQDSVFQQVSYVNAICTIKGGTHVECVANQVVAKLMPVLKRKNKSEVCVRACSHVFFSLPKVEFGSFLRDTRGTYSETFTRPAPSTQKLDRWPHTRRALAILHSYPKRECNMVTNNKNG